MKKIIVKILNLVYLAAAVFAIVCYLTKPLFSLQLGVKISGDDLASVLPGEKTEDETKNYRLVYRAEESETPELDISSVLTPEKLAGAIGDIEINLDIKITAKQALDINNTQVFNEILVSNIDGIKDMLADILSEKLPTLIKEVAKDFASTVMTGLIQDQINSLFQGAEGEEPAVSAEEVSAIVDNIYNVLDSEEPATVEQLSTAIMGDREYDVADPQPTSETFADGTYYTKAEEVYTKAEEYAADTTYYVVSGYTPGVLSVLNNLKESGTPGFEDVDLEEISLDEIQDTMVEALSSIPGLTTSNYVVAEEQPTSETFADGKYFIQEGDSYVRAEEYAADTTYYVEEVTINNIDSAIEGLLGLLLNSSDEGDDSEIGEIEKIEQEEQEEISKSRLMVRAEGEEPSEEEIENTTKKLILELIDKFVPIDATSIDLSLGGYASYVLAGLIGLSIIPWAWFGLKTLIRTIRPRKCWTKPYIVFVFAFLQLIFGVALTYGIKFGLPFAIAQAGSLIPAQYAGLLGGISLSITTSALIPSMIYIGMIPFTIIYIIFAHGVKVDYKDWKKQRKHN